MFGLPDSEWPAHGSYEAQSPSLGRVIRYDDEEIWREVERIEADAAEHGHDVGLSLFSLVPLFASEHRFAHPDAARWMRDFRLVRSLHTPPAATLDDVPAHFADAVLVMEHEEAAAMNEKRRRAPHG